MGVWMVLFLMILCRDTLALINVSSAANWSLNATTVAGKASATSGSAIGYLNSNEWIFITDDDILYVGDAGNNRIMVVSLNGMSSVSSIGTGPGSNANQFNYPSGVFVTDTSIYVMDVLNYRVQKWTRNATNPVTIIGSSYIGYAYFLFVDQYNNLYVSDCVNQNVIKFAPNSSTPVTVAGNGTAGAAASQLSCPLGIFVDDVGTVYVADYWNNRIQKWMYGASSGITVAGNGLSGSSLSQLNNPKSVVVDTNGYIYIVDNKNNRIMRWAPNATSGVCIIACTGTSGIRPDQLNGPVGLAFDSSGSIYISDMNNNRVQKFQIFSNASSSTTTLRTTLKSTTSYNSLTSAQVSYTNRANSSNSTTTQMLITSTARLSSMTAIESTSSIIRSNWMVWIWMCVYGWIWM